MNEKEYSLNLIEEIEKKMSSVFKCSLSPELKKAFENIKRHDFIPTLFVYDEKTEKWSHYRMNYANPDEKALKEIYTDKPVVIFMKDNEVISTSSQPSLMAYMIELAEINRGAKVLEIGTGSGYNAAILSEIAGQENVVTIDIEEDLAKNAEINIKRIKKNIKVIAGDGAEGYKELSPYNAVIVTCATPDMPWFDQIAEGGRVIIPLLTRGIEILCKFTKTGGHFIGKAVLPVRFLTFTGVNSIMSDYKKNVKSLEKLLLKAEVLEDFSAKLNKLERMERFSFLYYLSLIEKNAIYFISESKELENGYGIWKKDPPYGIIMIYSNKVAWWGDRSVVENLEEHFNKWNERRIMFGDYSIDVYPFTTIETADGDIVIDKKFNKFVFNIIKS